LGSFCHHEFKNGDYKKKKEEFYSPLFLLKRLSFFRKKKKASFFSLPLRKSFHDFQIFSQSLQKKKLPSSSKKTKKKFFFHFSFNTPSSQHLTIKRASFLLLSQILFQSYNSILPTSLTNILLLNQRLFT